MFWYLKLYYDLLTCSQPSIHTPWTQILLLMKVDFVFILLTIYSKPAKGSALSLPAGSAQKTRSEPDKTRTLETLDAVKSKAVFHDSCQRHIRTIITSWQSSWKGNFTQRVNIFNSLVGHWQGSQDLQIYTPDWPEIW